VLWNDGFRIGGIEGEAHRSALLERLLAEYGCAVYSANGFAIYELEAAN
jgi:hypothetical protein